MSDERATRTCVVVRLGDDWQELVRDAQYNDGIPLVVFLSQKQFDEMKGQEWSLIP